MMVDKKKWTMKSTGRIFPSSKHYSLRSVRLLITVCILGLLQTKLASCNWAEWQPWSECNPTCGDGVFTTRSRICEGDFMSCLGPNFEGGVCELPPCPVDGEWHEWSVWTNCTAECGGGEKYHERTCQQPMYGGLPCDGNYNETVPCNVEPCPVDGNWTGWGDWETCSVSCGGGIQNSTRSCIGPFYGGLPCEGIDLVQQECNMQPCPIDGVWASWGEWSECSTTCNLGLEKRVRSCTNPPPEHGGLYCPGRRKQTRNCYQRICPSHGGWSLWTEWTECSTTCNWGVRRRYRLCDNPVPNFGGSYCVGSASGGESCTMEPCPVNAQWGEWGTWTNCSEACGSGGRYYRERICDSPPSLFGGETCQGERGHWDDCYVQRCDVDGDWSDWSEWSECSKPCETGMQMRDRTCDNPEPTPPDGEYCREHSNETRTCNIHICPVHGGWTPWSSWTKCPVTCAGDIETRFRTCTNPPPLFRGNDCDGLPNEERDCNTDGCPVDGAWTAWTSWTECSVICGGGSASRTRTCSNPATAWGGNPCPKTDPDEEWMDCNEFPCPIPGGWAQWSNWTLCSVTCGGSIVTRNRTCDEPVPQHGGDDCPGNTDDTAVCNDNPCPINGSWSNWSAWGECSVECEGGIQYRTRTCSDPSPAYGGFLCPSWEEDDDEDYDDEYEEETGGQMEVLNQTCNVHMCPIDGGWTEWTEWPDCPVTCGGATIYKYRNCTNPTPMYLGDDCIGHNISELICNGDIQCPIHGDWGRWLDWGLCSKSCEAGITKRIRLCNNPSPLYGGRKCNGSMLEEDVCNDIQCPVHGGFTPWTKWTTCTKSCGGGQTQRIRACTNPAPKFGGNDCYGVTMEKKLCSAFYCPVHGGFSEWSPWSTCTVTCGGAVAYRSRSCTNPSPKHGGLPCEGPLGNSTMCNTNPCPIDGSWAEWSGWSSCSTSCGDGIQESYRECADPEPQYGGDVCLGDDLRLVYCIEQDTCPVVFYIPSNITVNYDTKNAEDQHVTIHWSSPTDPPLYYIIDLKRLFTAGVPAANLSLFQWRTFATVLGIHNTYTIKSANTLDLFQGEFAVRVSTIDMHGQGLSGANTFPTIKFSTSGGCRYTANILLSILHILIYLCSVIHRDSFPLT